MPVIFARQPSAWAISHLKSKMKFSAIQEGVVIPRYLEVVQTMWVQKWWDIWKDMCVKSRRNVRSIIHGLRDIYSQIGWLRCLSQDEEGNELVRGAPGNTFSKVQKRWLKRPGNTHGLCVVFPWLRHHTGMLCTSLISIRLLGRHLQGLHVQLQVVESTWIQKATEHVGSKWKVC